MIEIRQNDKLIAVIQSQTIPETNKILHTAGLNKSIKINLFDNLFIKNVCTNEELEINIIEHIIELMSE